LKTEKCITCLALNTKDCENLTDPEKGKCMRTYFRNLIKEENYKLLPLPLAEMKCGGKGSGIYRSVTCLTYWSLVMLKNALSPEILFPEIAFIDAEEFNEMTQDLNENLKRELDKKLNHRAFFSRVRQSRTAFYQLEEALHYQLKQLFLDKEFRDKNLYNDDTIDKTTS
jgi:hypothetical protein